MSSRPASGWSAQDAVSLVLAAWRELTLFTVLVLASVVAIAVQ